MKFTVDVDCTPQEARAFLGLPDMESVHEAYLGRIKEAMRDGVTPAMVQDMLKKLVADGRRRDEAVVGPVRRHDRHQEGMTPVPSLGEGRLGKAERGRAPA